MSSQEGEWEGESEDVLTFPLKDVPREFWRRFSDLVPHTVSKQEAIMCLLQEAVVAGEPITPERVSAAKKAFEEVRNGN